MTISPRGRAAIKFTFWMVAATGLCAYLVHAHVSGKLAAWFYHTTTTDGLAVNADSIHQATQNAPIYLKVEQADRIDGLVAVPVKRGERLPARANGVISEQVLKEGKRATLEGGQLKVTVPWLIEQAKGFKFKDTFKHKGIKTYPWAGVFNVLMIFSIGIALGYMAEGFTDLIGVKLEKIKHFQGH